MNNYKETLVH